MRTRTLSLGLALLLLVAALPLAAQTRTEYRGLWVETFNSQLGTHAEIDRVIQNCVDSNCNAIFAQIRRRGDSWYLDTLEPLTVVTGVGEPVGGKWTFDPLAYLIQQAHLRGIEVHAYVIITAIHNSAFPPADPKHVFNQHFWNTATNALRADADPDMWATRALPHNLNDGTNTTNANGHRFPADWYLDLGHPEAAAYTVDVLTHLVEKYDVDGIHLDRIRYPDAPIDRLTGKPYSMNDGYNERNVQRFKAHYPNAAYYTTADVGQPASNTPVRLVVAGDVGYPRTEDAQWNQWRRDQVTNFVRRLYLSVTAVKPQIKVSAALICSWTGPAASGGWTGTEPYRRVFQDWDAWTREGILDIVAPMAYKREHSTAAGASNEKAQFDDWMSYTKSLTASTGRQGMIGLGAYINSIEGTLPQIRRSLALAPYTTLSPATGVIIYALGDTLPTALVNNSTNAAVASNPLSYPTAGVSTPKRLNSEFFSAVRTGASTTGLLFESSSLTPVFAGGPAAIPPMPWKQSPTLGHLRGFAKRADGTPLDTASVTIENVATGLARSTTTDGGGFFGGVGLAPGTYRARVTLGPDTVYACVANVAAGHVASSDARPELTAPITALAQSATGWTNDDVTLTLTPTDDCSGVVATETSVDGAPWQPYAAPVVFSAEGISSVQYRSRDWAANVENAKSTVVQIDKTAPVVTISAPLAGTSFVYGQASAASYGCSDSLSGISTCDGSSADGGAVDTLTVGARSFNVTATDVAGNVTSQSNAYTVGKAATAIAFSYSEDRNRVTLIATLSVVAPGGGSPAGSVEFIDKHGSLGTAPVVNGVATLTVQKRSLQLTLAYSGSANYLAVSSDEFHFEPRPQ